MRPERALRQLNELRTLGNTMRLAADGWKEPWQTLIAIIMSARTRDEVTIAVSERLFKRYPTVERLARASRGVIEKIIRPVNFYRNKAKSVLNCARSLVTNHHGRPPETVEELVLLPGVGRKTANVFLTARGYDAIGVDTHVAYISRELGWTKNRDPHKIEKDLEALFPQHIWKDVNTTCVQFGKTHLSRKKKKALLMRIRSL